MIAKSFEIVYTFIVVCVQHTTISELGILDSLYKGEYTT